MKKIMVVDDEADQILTVKYTIEQFGEDYDIITAKSGPECLKILETNLPDLILLDIMMPKMSGCEVFKKIKENTEWVNIPIIFLTARTDRTAENAGNFFAEAYIEKPFEFEDLKIKIKQLLRD
jgi:CheY-like chemotaxis protein